MGELIIPDLSHQIYQIKGLISIRNFNSIIGKKNMFCGGLQEGNRFEIIHPEKIIS